MTDKPHVVQVVVPRLGEELPDEVKNAVVLRREIYNAGVCSKCNRKLPTGEQLEKYFTSTRDIVDERVRREIVMRYFDHAEFCRGHIDRVKALAKRNGLSLEEIGFEIWSLDLDKRKIAQVDPLPDGTRLEDVVEAYRRIVREREG